MTDNAPHQNQPVLTSGQPLAKAKAAMVLLHGRGATPEDILSLGEELYHPEFAYLAPQAAGYTWYPYSFLAPIEKNEPGISSGILAIEALVDSVIQAGIPARKIIIGGFSQGACLALEFVARHTQYYGGVLGFSGGLIGPDSIPRDYKGSLEGTPIFLGCSDVDFHIPKERVKLTAEILGNLGGDVTMRLYPGMGHTINRDELLVAQTMVDELLSK